MAPVPQIWDTGAYLVTLLMRSCRVKPTLFGRRSAQSMCQFSEDGYERTGAIDSTSAWMLWPKGTCNGGAAPPSILVFWKDESSFARNEEVNVSDIVTFEENVIIGRITLWLQQWTNPSNESRGPSFECFYTFVSLLMDEQ